MKIFQKIVAAFCGIALFLSSFVVSADTSVEFQKGTPGSFYGLVWIPRVNESMPNIYTMFRDEKFNPTIDDIPKIANNMKADLLSKPAGKRAWCAHGIIQWLLKGGKGTETVFWDGSEEQRKILRELLDYYKRINGPDIDYIITDWENGFDAWRNATAASKEGITEAKFYDKIIADPRYLTEIRPRLVELGFDFDFAREPGENELASVYKLKDARVPGSTDLKNVYIWNIVSKERTANYLQYSMFDIFAEYFPNAKLCNYANYAIPQGSIHGYDGNGHRTTDYGSFKYVGNYSCTVSYGHIGNKTINVPPGYQFMTFQKTPFNSFLSCIPQSQTAYLNTPGNKLMSWIAWPEYSGDTRKPPLNGIQGTDWFNEMVLQLGMLNVEFLIWIDNQSIEYTTYYDHGDKKTSDLFYELDEVAGFDDRRSLVEEVMDINNRYILQGMYAGGRNVWRITPDLFTPGVTLENFCIDKERPTFQIGNQFVKFPEGSFIYTPEKSNSKYGYWVISPKDTRPEEWREPSIPAAPEPVYDGVKAYNDLWAKRNGTATSTESSTTPAMKSYKDVLIANMRESETIDDGKYPDIKDHWAKDVLKNMINRKVINGDGQYIRPDDKITKAEFLAMLTRLLEKEATPYKGMFSDVNEDDWYAGIIQASVDLNLIVETSGEIHPEEELSREEMVEILMRAYRPPSNENIKDLDKIKFIDEDLINPEALESIKKAVVLGFIQGYTDGTFRPADICTRAEVAKMLDNFTKQDVEHDYITDRM